MPHPDYPDDKDQAQHPTTFYTKPKAARQHGRAHGNKWHVELMNGPGPCYRLWITPLGPHDDPPLVDHNEDPHLFIGKTNLPDNHCWKHFKQHGPLRNAIRAAIERSQE
jgi:hypothetical protein